MQQPGPGNYSPRTQQKSLNIGIDKAKRNTYSTEKLKIPGVGSYDINKNNNGKSKYSFPKDQKFSNDQR